MPSFCRNGVPALFRALILNIPLHDILTHVAERAHEVAMAPEMTSPKGMISDLRVVLEEDLRAVTLQVLNDAGWSVLRLEAYEHVDMLRHDDITCYFHMGISVFQKQKLLLQYFAAGCQFG